MNEIEFDYEKYPDGISETLNLLDHEAYYRPRKLTEILEVNKNY